MKEKERQTHVIHQKKSCLQHSHPEKRDIIKIEIQGVERRHESLPVWMDVKSHTMHMLWKKNQSDI